MFYLLRFFRAHLHFYRTVPQETLISTSTTSSSCVPSLGWTLALLGSPQGEEGVDKRHAAVWYPYEKYLVPVIGITYVLSILCGLPFALRTSELPLVGHS